MSRRVLAAALAVPHLVGLRYPDAARRAQTAGFRVRLLFTKRSDQPAGTVVAQQPVAASTTGDGATLTLIAVRRR